MKKQICIMLILVMVFGMCACTGNGDVVSNGDDASGLRVGFGREMIMPKSTVRISGGGDESRLSTGFLDYLYVTCIAVTDGEGETVLIYTQDLISTNESYLKDARQSISEATGIAEDHIMMSATHIHSGPAIATGSSEGIADYRELHKKAVVQAAQTALEDRSSAEVYIGSTQTDGLTFVRHYLLSNGTYAGSNFGDFNSGTIVSHAAEADQEAQIIKFSRAAGDKKDILMMNFGVHPCFFGATNNTVLTADLVGATRDYIETQTGSLVAYFTSDAGNQSCSSKIKGEEVAADYKNYGEILGQYVIDTLSGLSKIEGSAVQIKQQKYTADSNKEKLEMLGMAKEVVQAYKTSGAAAADPLAVQYGFSSIHEARAIVSRLALDDTLSFDLNVLSIGNHLSLILAPYEMFAANGMYIKENTPYDMTFLVTCANGDAGYLPSDAAFEHGCYEVYITKCVRGTAESVADTLLDMLTELKNG